MIRAVLKSFYLRMVLFLGGGAIAVTGFATGVVFLRHWHNHGAHPVLYAFTLASFITGSIAIALSVLITCGHKGYLD